ncbi:MAG TPA: sensor domain-containing diguanylate cyclase [Microthrixaceae bacterium]|nr:sensor domain-containing diguanylate cyclase [Microthrixaceae bacterium]
MHHDGAEGARNSLASIAVYGMGPIVLVAYGWLRSEGLIAPTPLWLFVALLVIAGVSNLGTAWLCKADPASMVKIHLRSLAAAFATAGVIYATGWGSMLAIGFALGSAELLRTIGSRSWVPSLVWNLIAIGVAEVALGLGWTPSLVDRTLAHALAVTGAVCLAIVTSVLGNTARAREAAEGELRVRGQHYESLMRHATDMIGVIGDGSIVRSVSPAIRSMLGYEPVEVEGRGIATLLHPSEPARLAELLSDMCGVSDSSHTLEVRLRHRDGSDRLAVVTFTNPAGGVPGDVVLNLHDITTQRELEERLRHDAMHDPLTGLLNRAAFLDALGRSCARADRERLEVALLFVDLDGFKEINDTLGHVLGDELLIRAADRLRACLRGGETIARLGGDEFVVLVDPIASDRVPVSIAQRLLGSLDLPPADLTEIGRLDAAVSASIGIARRRPGSLSPEELLCCADEAMYAAKRAGRGRWAEADTDLPVTVR